MAATVNELCREVTRFAEEIANGSGRKCLFSGVPIEYEIDPGEGLVKVRCSGSFTIDQMIRHSLRVNEDPRFKPGMDTLIDFRHADLADDVEALSRYVDHSSELAQFRGSSRWACLVADEFDSDLIWTFDLVVRSRGIDIKTKAFLDESAALAWLAEPKDGMSWA
ncbi:MAG: hypothetical protein KDN19_01450 [Verrucomicrobiae bacterium]|nr:hypothetical protein [Verrucomicrobiae bacterium]